MDERPKRSGTGSASGGGAHRAGLTLDHRVSDIVRDVVSPCPRALNPDAMVLEAAEVKRRDDIGDVLVMADEGRILQNPAVQATRCLAFEATPPRLAGPVGLEPTVVGL